LPFISTHGYGRAHAAEAEVVNACRAVTDSDDDVI